MCIVISHELYEEHVPRASRRPGAVGGLIVIVIIVMPIIVIIRIVMPIILIVIVIIVIVIIVVIIIVIVIVVIIVIVIVSIYGLGGLVPEPREDVEGDGGGEARGSDLPAQTGKHVYMLYIHIYSIYAYV